MNKKEMIQVDKIKKNKKVLLISIFIICLVAIDQITKFFIVGYEKNIINDFLKICIVQNYGGAFGVGQTGTMTFIITNVIVIGIIIRFMHMQEKQIDKRTYFALSLIIAGAIANLIDKLFKGYVVEFIVIKSLAFNFADILIVLGWILLALFFATYTYKIKSKKGDKVE